MNQDLINILRKRWEETKDKNADPRKGGETPKVENIPGTESAESSTVSSPGNPSSLKPIHKIHLLPLDGGEAINSSTRLSIVLPELSKYKLEGTLLKSGLIIPGNDGPDFVVLTLSPLDGQILTSETDIYLDGLPVTPFDRVQFLVTDTKPGSEQTPEMLEALFTQVLLPYLSDNSYDPTKVPPPSWINLVQVGLTFTIGDQFKVFLQAASQGDKVSSSNGYFNRDTQFFMDWDPNPVFEKIHIVPFEDTLPVAYSYDIFNGYLNPYFKGNQAMRTLRKGETFIYNAVQFKVLYTDPDEVDGHVTSYTDIYCSGTLTPTLVDLLPPEFLNQLAHFSPTFQYMILNSDTLGQVGGQSIYERMHRLESGTTVQEPATTPAQIDKLTSYRNLTDTPETEETCMVCLSNFSKDELLRELPCQHTFHVNCIDEWLARSNLCPICKQSVT